MTTGRIELGPTGRAVAANLKRLRAARGLSLRALSEALGKAGRNLSPDALNKIENGASDETKQIRRADVDDVVALAVALGVSPAALLLPITGQPTDSIDVTGAGSVTAAEAWGWASGERPLRLTPGKEREELVEHRLYGVPAWLWPGEGRTDASITTARLRQAGFPVDDWLADMGLIERPGGDGDG